LKARCHSLDFQNGFVFSPPWQVRQKIKLDDIALDILFVAEPIGLAGLEPQRFREQVLDAIDGLPLTRSGAQENIDIETHAMSGLGMQGQLFQEWHPAAADYGFNVFLFESLRDLQQLRKNRPFAGGRKILGDFDCVCHLLTES
jgi:hypothetical protein